MYSFLGLSFLYKKKMRKSKLVRRMNISLNENCLQIVVHCCFPSLFYNLLKFANVYTQQDLRFTIS